MHPACPNKKQNHLQNSLLRRTQFWVRKTFSKPASLKRASLAGLLLKCSAEVLDRQLVLAVLRSSVGSVVRSLHELQLSAYNCVFWCVLFVCLAFLVVLCFMDCSLDGYSAKRLVPILLAGAVFALCVAPKSQRVSTAGFCAQTLAGAVFQRKHGSNLASWTPPTPKKKSDPCAQALLLTGALGCPTESATGSRQCNSLQCSLDGSDRLSFPTQGRHAEGQGNRTAKTNKTTNEFRTNHLPDAEDVMVMGGIASRYDGCERQCTRREPPQTPLRRPLSVLE